MRRLISVLAVAVLGAAGAVLATTTTATTAAAVGPIVNIASTPNGGGYWLVASDGQVRSFGDAKSVGDMSGRPLNQPMVGMSSSASGNGYWLVAKDGGIFAFGDAPFYGSTGSMVLNKPVVAMAPTPTGKGYWFTATDGGVFAFGDAGFYGSTGNLTLNKPVNGMTVSPTGKGYRLVAEDGGVFSFGDAPFYGSTGGSPPADPIVGMAPAPGNTGYWTVTSRGKVFAFGTAVHAGDLANTVIRTNVVGIASNPSGQGYRLALADGSTYGYGASPPGGQGSTPPVSGLNSVVPIEGAPNCPVFPSDHVLNTPITAMPVMAGSAAYISSIGSSSSLKADFGSGLYQGSIIGIPFNVVGANQAKVNVTFGAGASESDAGPYPIPNNPIIEGGGDRHLLTVDRDSCLLYELYLASQSNGSWSAYSGAIFDLKSNNLRPAGWTSADAAGLAILPGLVRYEEVAAGHIDHAIRITVPSTQRLALWPARHFASSNTNSALPPLGLRLRLKASVDISGYPRDAQVILQALKTYGAIVADNGSAWYISGAPDSRWDNDVLQTLGGIKGSNFDAVDVSSLLINVNSGAARQ